MEIYVKVIGFPYFLFYSGFQPRCYHIHWFYPYRSFRHNNWWRRKLGHTEYLIQTYYILVLILCSKLTKNGLNGGFNTI